MVSQLAEFSVERPTDHVVRPGGESFNKAHM